MPLEDRYGRVATDLRVSLTDRCNLRCSYCMPAEGLDWLPERRRPHRRRGGPADRHRRPRRSASARSGSPAASRWSAAVWSTSSVAPRRSTRARDLADHQRARPRAQRAGARRGRARPGQRQPRHGPSGHLPHDHPARPARRRRRRARGGARPPGWRRSRSTRCCCAASTTTRRPSCCAGASSDGYELRFIEQMPLDAQHGWSRDGDGHRRRDLRAASSAEFALTPGRGAAGQRPGRAVPGRRRPGHGRRHRLGHPAVLRRLRPGPAHRRRPGAQLPVRPRGVRPAHGAARRRDDEELADRWRVAMRGKRPGHGIDDPRSCSPPARCPPSAAEPATQTGPGSVRRLRRSGTDVAEEAARGQEVAQRLRCSSQASHVLRRSGVCSLGLFHSSAQTARR